jgi:hypothetical protein
MREKRGEKEVPRKWDEKEKAQRKERRKPT